MLKGLTVAQVFSDISANLTTEKTAVDITDALMTLWFHQTVLRSLHLIS